MTIDKHGLKLGNPLCKFSEDVDLALNREFLGFASGLISKSQVRRLRAKSYAYIKEKFSNDLKSAF